jgi:hypothetical protein
LAKIINKKILKNYTKLIDAAPKKFAASLGFIFSISIFTSLFFNLSILTNLLIIFFIIALSLEIFLNYCIGCKIYSILCLIKKNI